jgi:hypothetical protein
MPNDGPNPTSTQTESQAQSAGTLRVVSSVRSMKTYVVTSNEIRTITLVNFGVTVLFSLGSACLGYWLNIHTEIALAGKLPAGAEVVQTIVQPVALVAGIVFYVIGAITWFFRSGFVSTIEKESLSKD